MLLADRSTRTTLVGKLEGKPLLAEEPLKLLGDLEIGARQNAVEKLDHRDFGAEPPPHRTELEADHPRPDHHQMFGHLVAAQRAGRRHDLFLVDVDALEPRRVGARGDDDRLGRELFASIRPRP